MKTEKHLSILVGLKQLEILENVPGKNISEKVRRAIDAYAHAGTLAQDFSAQKKEFEELKDEIKRGVGAHKQVAKIVIEYLQRVEKNAKN